MKIKSAQFQISATDLKSCPRHDLPEFAFIGRSNVGKSSLINLLTEKRDLAKVSATPGKTKLLNFFRINEAWTLVDLPGYGYAKVSKTQSADFSEAVAGYLEHREGLRRIFVLIDSMLPPQKIDIQFLRWLNEVGLTHTLLFTKTDRQSPTATRKAIAAFTEVMEELSLPIPPVIACSVKNKDGRTEVLRVIAEDIGVAHKPRRSGKSDTKEQAAHAPSAQAHKPTAHAHEPIPAPSHKAAPLPKAELRDEEDFFVRQPGKPRVWRP